MQQNEAGEVDMVLLSVEIKQRVFVLNVARVGRRLILGRNPLSLCVFLCKYGFIRRVFHF